MDERSVRRNGLSARAVQLTRSALPRWSERQDASGSQVAQTASCAVVTRTSRQCQTIDSGDLLLLLVTTAQLAVCATELRLVPYILLLPGEYFVQWRRQTGMH